jgi:tRNA U55 pseudouridine synthase TruB
MGEEPKNFDFIKGEVLLFDKALDWTSFDLVQKVRNNLCRAMKIKKLKVGHAGTLDPKATGLMILCTGKATKQIEMHQAGEKEYLASIKLGATTPSFDLETEEDAQFDTKHITQEKIELRVVCSKGTYIRALARDIGKALDSGAYLIGLRRTRIGDFKVDDALSLTDFLKNIDKFVTN